MASTLTILTASPVISMPDGETSNTGLSLYRPSLWINGNVKATVFYSGSAGSTNNVRLKYVMNAVATAENIATGTDVSVTQSVAGPATANTDKSVELTTQLPVVSTTEMITVVLTRLGLDGSDNYAGTFYITGVLLTYVPTAL